jgi:hypothetical protein
MKRKAEDRERNRNKVNANWNPELQDKVLFKCQNNSDASKGAIDKLMLCTKDHIVLIKYYLIRHMK